MKFRKMFSLSVVLSTGLVLGGAAAFFETDTPGKKQKPVQFMTRPDLKIKTDTIYMTNENFDSLSKTLDVGQFRPMSNSVYMFVFKYDDTANPRVKRNCDKWNGAARVVLRHEMEHARKADAVYNIKKRLSRWDRARVAIMNETMAPAAEIIESQEYRMETGMCFPAKRIFLWPADSMIMARHNQIHNENARFKPVDFSDSLTADIVLKCAINQFVRDYNRGFYRFVIQRNLKSQYPMPYTPNNQCDKIPAEYAPEMNQWGALWTYDINAPWYIRRRVDVWNSATDAARQYVISKVDSIVNVELEPGQKLNPDVFEKPR